MQNSMGSPSLKVYRSSAGSGKTFTLVKEYLKIVFAAKNPNAFKEILAITFTNKAANEMKERIIDALYSLSNGDDQLLEIYALELELNKKQIREKSKKILSKVLHQYSDFSVFTIDKFTHRLIRSFSQELGLTFNFNVELNEKDFLNECVARLLELIGKDKDLTTYLFQFIEQNLGDSTKSNIEKQLAEFKNLIFKGNRDDILLDFEHLSIPYFSSIRDQFYKELIELDKNNFQLGKDCYDLMMEHGIDEDYFYKRTQRFPKIYNLLRSQDNYDIKDIEKWEEWLDENRWMATKLDSSKVIVFESVLPELIQNTSLIIINAKRIVFLREVLKLFTAYSLINQLVNEVEVYKKEKSILLISDFNRLISQIIRNEPASFIFERIGTRYKHFLFDEFQDTSIRQWSNLVPLVHESLSKGGVNLLVGDAKQAIYRWREGDVDQFLDLPKIDESIPFSEDISQLFKNYFFADQLNVNRRSLPEIINFNNWLFAGLLSKISLTKIAEAYKSHEQQTFRNGAGYVECIVCTDKVDHFNFKLNYLSDVIKRCLKNGYSFKDIAVIVRKNKEGTEVAHFLQNHDFPVVSGESIVLSSSFDVVLLIDAMKALEFDDEHSKLNVIQSLSNKNLTELYFSYLFDVNNIYNRKIDLLRFLNDLVPSFIHQEYRSLDLIEKIYYILRTFKINQFSPYIERFLDLLFDFIQQNGATIKGFIEYYDKEAERTSVDIGSQDAIQIITVHKSKGLQFPVVIMPFASWPDKERSSRELIWVQSEDLKDKGINTFIGNNDEQSLKRLNKYSLFLEEKEQLIFDNLNLYYVAFTRAQDRLYMSLGPSPNNILKPNVKDLIMEQIIADENYDPEINLFSMGEEKDTLDKEVNSDSLYDYSNEIQANKYDLALSLDKNNSIVAHSGQQLFGILLHQALEKVIYDFKPAINNIKTLINQHKISNELASELIRTIELIKNNKELETFFRKEYQVYNEIEISCKGGRTFRIDRLLVKNNKITLIDYKTGIPKEKDQQQLRDYVSLIKEIGHTVKECFLIYLPELRIEKVVL